MNEIDLYIIGVEEYKEESNKFEYLPGVLADINKIFDYSNDKNVFSKITRHVNLRRNEFLNLIKDIEESTSDIVVIYFSGYGYINDGEHYLVLEDDVFFTKDLLSKSSFKNKHLILVLDCCYSGQIVVDYDFELIFDSKEAGTSKTIFSASEDITVENNLGGYFTEDLLAVMQNCNNNMSGSLNIDSIFFELMEISKKFNKNYHVYTNNFSTIDINAINPCIFNSSEYPEIAYQEFGEIFKIDSQYKDSAKIYTVYIKLYEENYSTKTIYYNTRKIFNSLKKINLYKNGFEKINSNKPLELVYCNYYTAEIRSDLSKRKYLSYYGDISIDEDPSYPFSRDHIMIGGPFFTYQYDYRNKIESRNTVNNEEIQKNGRALEYRHCNVIDELQYLESDELIQIINNFFELYKEYLKEFMTVWLNFINNVISRDELFKKLGELDKLDYLKNYSIDYQTEDTKLAVQLQMLNNMKKEMDYIKKISLCDDDSVEGFIYNYQSGNKKELLLLDCIINLKRNYSLLYY